MNIKQQKEYEVNQDSFDNNENKFTKFIDSLDLGILGIGAVGLITLTPYLLAGETILGITITKEMIPLIVNKIPLLAKGMETLGATAIGSTVVYTFIKDYSSSSKFKVANKKARSPRELNEPIFNFKNQIFEFSATKDKD